MCSTVVVRLYFKFIKEQIQLMGIWTYVFRYDYETLTFLLPTVAENCNRSCFSEEGEDKTSFSSTSVFS